MMKTKPREIEKYLSLPHTTILQRDEDGYVIARIDELQGCISHGKDESEALSNLADMKRLWITDALAANEIIPPPARVSRVRS
jgi:predicted RNase H-like HicB family nuclease